MNLGSSGDVSGLPTGSPKLRPSNSLGVGDFIGNPKSKFPFGNDSILTANLVLSNNTYREEKSGSCRDGEGVD